MAKNADVGNFWHVFAILKPLTGIKTLSNYWWVICENRLRIGFRNEFLSFTSQNEVELATSPSNIS